MSDKVTIDELLQIVKKSETSFNEVLKKITFISIGDGHCSAEVKIDQTHLNHFGVLHGGFSATLIDVISWSAIWSQARVPGVTVDLHIRYLKAAKAGDEIIVDARTIKTGENLAFVEAEIRNKATGNVLVKGSQTTYLAHSQHMQ